jgi:hypothetical protein
MQKPDMNAAHTFLANTARVLDQRRFDRLYHDGPVVPVRDAVAAYRNSDGGFGHGLEPDLRCPASQPAAAELALRILHEAEAWDAELVSSACDWLAANSPDEGGAAFVLPGADTGPHAPWWVVEDGLPASLIGTGMIAGTLHARSFSHPWLDRATSLMWSRIDGLTQASGYEMFGVLRFLDHVPDRPRAEAAAAKVGQLLFDCNLVALDPEAGGEVHGPLDFAPAPDSVARRLFEPAVIDAHLDHLAAGQLDDGGWMFNWMDWSPGATADWRGFLTVDAIRVLRANGRL